MLVTSTGVGPELSVTLEIFVIVIISVYLDVKLHRNACTGRQVGQSKARRRIISRIRRSSYFYAARHKGSPGGDIVGEKEIDFLLGPGIGNHGSVMQGIARNGERLIHALHIRHSDGNHIDGNVVCIFGISDGSPDGVGDRIGEIRVIDDGSLRHRTVGADGIRDGDAAAGGDIGERESRDEVVRRLRDAVDDDAARDVARAAAHDVLKENVLQGDGGIVGDDHRLLRRFSFGKERMIRTFHLCHRAGENFRIDDVAALFSALRRLIGQNVIIFYIRLIGYYHNKFSS